MRTFRDHLADLESAGLLERMDAPVDPEWELASVARWLYHGFDDADRFALYFEDVAGYDMPVVAAALGASRRTYLQGLGLPPDAEPEAVHDRWHRALSNHRDPTLVSTAPVQQRVATGADASLGDLPVPVWTPAKDPDPYLTAVVVTKNRETGVRNMAIYRCQVVDETTIAINISARRHAFMDYQSYAESGDPAPVAIAVGASPAVHYSSITNVDYEVDEAALAGGLLGEPLEMVRAETVDLDVPAAAELVIEGEIDPEARRPEGPFGEFAGYMGHRSEKPVIDVTAVTARSDPVFYSLMGQVPPSEDHTIQSISNAALYREELVDGGYESVSDLYIDRTYSGILGHGVIALDPNSPGEGRDAGIELATGSQLKRVTVVNDDVDVRDPLHVAWAVNARADPSRDATVLEDVYLNPAKDPAVRTDPLDRSDTSKLVIDATVETIPEDLPPMAIPPKEDMEAALDTWAAADVPDPEPKRRMELLLDRHPGPDVDRP
ncbi:MAG: UbiD family decarboxylase [Halobacteriales archaeon]